MREITELRCDFCNYTLEIDGTGCKIEGLNCKQCNGPLIPRLETVGNKRQTGTNLNEVEHLARKASVLFYSEDGRNYKCFVDGVELQITIGIKITAGCGEDVVVSPNLLAAKGIPKRTFREVR